ncbi:VCBS repeat-containing protein [Alteromonas pelagimontana]|uniref:VCBS repeat-containing protein n=1 Tax=Alteromonas pelagimontana TaxID=1858656 RepID=A0A6M4MD51_9ALTE|nr:VCBS repeat-containing protein [Alteromonas pelagimontana]QJR80768.1 VCBS repeat-containing protein [Alteromonas pelagimontana]
MYVADTDGDGEKDSGKVIDLYEFISTPVTDLALLPLSDISSQPQAESLNVITEKPVVSSDIVVEPGIYYDNETPQEQLTVSYNWYINNVLVEGLDGNTLPAFSAAPEDTVEVSMVVSDESHSVESYRHYIWIEDTPAVLTASSVPESISAGDTVTFSVVLTDADINGDDNLAKLTHAPEGASMADDGTVTWQVPKSLLFNQQSYSFGFSNRLNPNHHIEQTFSLVATAQQPMPLFRSGIEVPKYNQSQWIADFDGDGNNELLGTDSYQRIFLLELVEGKYQQKWAYPYVLNEEEIVRQVLPADIDKDGAPEILILTDHGMWLIEDINKPARKIYETEAYMYSAIIADTDGDGTDEIIYRTSDSEYSSDTAQVTVAELNDDLTEIFTFYTDAISDMAVGNVDSDANQELVLNNGIVYDLTTGANEWYLGTGFGSSFVTVGDMNGDGIDESLA